MKSGLLVFCVFIPLSLFGAQEMKGRCGEAFLKIGVGARATGMGGAFASVFGDGTAIYWNPAGIAGLRRREILAIHTRMFQGIGYEYLAYLHPFRKVCVGIGVGCLHVDGLERRGYGDELLGYFGARDMSFTFAFALKGKDLFFGASLKGIYQRIDKMSGYGYGLDAGIIHKGLDPNVSLAVSIKNIGILRFGKGIYLLPWEVRVGWAHRFFKGRLLFTSDLSYRIDTPKIKPHFGGELSFGEVVVRCGYGSWGPAFGAGFRHTKKILIDYDYAWMSHGELGDVHRFSVALKF
jgi:hypothetical protein